MKDLIQLNNGRVVSEDLICRIHDSVHQAIKKDGVEVESCSMEDNTCDISFCLKGINHNTPNIADLADRDRLTVDKHTDLPNKGFTTLKIIIN